MKSAECFYRTQNARIQYIGDKCRVSVRFSVVGVHCHSLVLLPLAITEHINAQNWMFYAAPNLRSLTETAVEQYNLHPLLLEFRYLVTTEFNAVIMKGWANAAHQNISSPSHLIHHCLEHNMVFHLAVPASVLTLFQCSIDDYSVNDRIAADVPFMPGFQESSLMDKRGPALLNASYRLKAAEVAARMNVGAAVAKGGSLGWLVRKLTGKEAVQKLLDGPSYVAAHLFNVEILPAAYGGKEVLMTENLTIGEEMALIGFVPGCTRKGPRILFPTLYLLFRFLKGFWGQWSDNVEALMNKRWDLVLKGEAEAMTEEEWGKYITDFCAEQSSDGSYVLSENDTQYGIDLFKAAYPMPWTTIRLHDLTLPEIYQGTVGFFEAY